jgi:hypothetical protein
MSASKDARAMGTSGKVTAVVGYNVQTAVDARHHLIVALLPNRHADARNRRASAVG